VAKLAFFVGKGGVGKTTVAAAYAVHTALQHTSKAVLLLSTDPAHSLSDVLEKPLEDEPAIMRVSRRAKLTVWQINAEKLFRDFLNKHKQQILSILESGSIFSREDIEPLLDTTLPGMAEMAALLAIHDALTSREYDYIVVDTAPIGHTLRLFALPEDFIRFLDFLELAASRDGILAAHFGGTGRLVGGELLQQWRAMVDRLKAGLADNAEIFLVTSPEKFAINESLRARDALRQYAPPLEVAGTVLNRIVKRGNNCKVCAARERAGRAAQALLKREFPGKKAYVGEDSGAPIMGVDGLKAFAEHVFDSKRLNWEPAPPRVPEPRLKRVEWPLLETPLTLVLGKGGVGKTTISAALGFATRAHSRSAVEICSVDPAPSLDDVFEKEIGHKPAAVLGDAKFRASEMDAVSIYRDWATAMKQAIEGAMTSERSSIHVDLWFERQLFSTLLDSVPPGLDEVMAVFRIVDLAHDKSRRLIIDMAPTGHALELLRTPQRILAWTRLLLKTLAAHRTLTVVQDLAVKIAEVGQRARELLELFRNAKSTHLYVVMLPEALPDRETERLLSALRSLQIKAEALFVNRVVFAKDAGNCTRCRRAHRWQMATLANLKRQDREIYVLRNFQKEIAGKRSLRSFTGELWRLV